MLTAISASILAWGLVASAAADTGRPVNEKREASPTGTVKISNVAGSVRVLDSGTNEVVVEGTLGEDAKLELTGSGENTRVEVKCPRERRFFGNGSKDCEGNIEVRVPKGSSVEIETVSASVAVSQITGAVDLETVSGDATVQDGPKKINAQSVSGTLKIDTSANRVKAESVSGDVNLHQVGGELEASSVSGDLMVDGSAFESVEMSSVSGSVHFNGSVSSKGKCKVESHSGTVDVTLPAGISAEFELESFSGDITSDMGGKAHRTSKYAPGKSLQFTTGDGGAQISLSSFSGDVKLTTK